MATQTDRLVKIGNEGFALMDKIYGKKPHRQQPCVYHGPEASIVKIAPAAAATYGVTRQCFDGTTPNFTASTINCDQAAEIYGGMVVMEYGKRKHFRQGYY